MSVIMKLMSPVQRYEAVSAQANLRKQVKRSGRSQNPIQQKELDLIARLTRAAMLSVAAVAKTAGYRRGYLYE